MDTLLALEQEKQYSSQLISGVLDKYDYLEGRDKAFLKRIVEGTIERQLELDYYLDQYASVPVNRMKPFIRCLLRAGVYQLLYMDNVPDSAACNEACKLAARRGFASLKGFVNGVLRTVARNKGRLPLPDEGLEPVKYFSVKYSMPEWLVELWLDEYGKDIAKTLLEGLLRIHPVSLRFRADTPPQWQEEWRRKLLEQGVEVSPSRYLPGCYFLEHGENIRRLPGFSEGRFTVQDVSSAFAVEAAGLRAGDFVVDVCAAPGGKSLLAAEKGCRVLSRDVSEEKAARIRENAERMRAENIEVQVFDGRQTDAGLLGRADAVLLDVPCSGLGVIGKKRDIKYRVNREGLESLSELQRQIVTASAGYVRPGGTLVYSTCTIRRAENEDMVRFIARELKFVPDPLEGLLPEIVLTEKRRLAELQGGVLTGHSAETPGEGMERGEEEARDGLTEEERAACIQLLPGFMETDGFFIARFRRPQ